jgi:hypothetical protein
MMEYIMVCTVKNEFGLKERHFCGDVNEWRFQSPELTWCCFIPTLESAWSGDANNFMTTQFQVFSQT